MKNNKATEQKKMYLTSAEAKAMGLPSMEEQIQRWNELQAKIRESR